MGRERTKYQGVYSRESGSKRHAGKPDACFEITYKVAGRKVWEKVGWKSEGYSAALAAEIRAERLRSLRHGDIPAAVAPRQALTFGEAWRKYSETRLAQIKNPKPDRSRYKANIAKRLGRLPLAAITPALLESLKSELLKAGKSPQSVKHVLTLIRRVFNWTAAQGLWRGKNPVQAMQLPDVDNKRYRYLTPAETQRLLALLRTRSLTTYRIALLALHTGMRAGEIFALRWGHVNLDAGLIEVLDAKAGSRPVHMTETIRKMFQEMDAGRGRADELVFLARQRKNDHKSPEQDGKQIASPSSTFERAVEALGLNEGVSDRRGRVVFHTLRHTYASWQAAAGVPLYVIAELLGHHDLEMTRRYAKLSPDQKREAVAHVEKAFSAGHES